MPYVWVDMPAFKALKMTSNILTFDDIYHLAAKKNGSECVDVWDGFVDKNGTLVSTGAVRLRSDDGITISRPASTSFLLCLRHSFRNDSIRLDLLQ